MHVAEQTPHCKCYDGEACRKKVCQWTVDVRRGEDIGVRCSKDSMWWAEAQHEQWVLSGWYAEVVTQDVRVMDEVCERLRLWLQCV